MTKLMELLGGLQSCSVYQGVRDIGISKITHIVWGENDPIFSALLAIFPNSYSTDFTPKYVSNKTKQVLLPPFYKAQKRQKWQHDPKM